MSLTPIRSLSAKRHEMGGSTKGQIYIAKMAIGCIAPWVWWVATIFWPIPFHAMLTISAIALTLSKVIYYARHPDRPIEWDAPLDWICDTALHFAWYAAYAVVNGEYMIPVILVTAWALSYPWSCE